MDRFSRFLYDPVKLLKALSVIVAGLCIVAYVWLQVSGGLNDNIETVAAMPVSYNDSVDGTAYIFRNEEVIQNSGNRVMVTVVSEGERVSNGQLIANAYENQADEVLQDEINRINRRLEILEKSFSDMGLVSHDVDKVESDISDSFADVRYGASRGDMSVVVESSAELLIAMNKKDIIASTNENYTDEVKELLEQKKSIESRINASSVPVNAPSKGYFYGSVDGYENIFTISEIDDIDVDRLDELANSSPDENILSDGAGKIVKDYQWYVACSFNTEQARGLVNGKKYTLSFPENGDETIEMTLKKVVTKNTSSTGVAVFRAIVSPEDFNFKRSQRVSVVLETKEGLAVPKKAIRQVNNVDGCYILVGDVVHFRSVEILETTDDYVIVSAHGNKYVHDSEKEKNKPKALSVYDNIIVSGKDLFDGKIV